MLVEINNHIMEGLVGMGASMSILVAIVVRELGIMHLVTRLESYETISRVVTQVMGKIEGATRVNWKNNLQYGFHGC